MPFQKINTEKDIDSLKKRILKDEALISRILEIRKGLRYSRRGGDKGIEMMPTNAELLALYHEMTASGEILANKTAELLLRKIKTKSNSGVAVVSILTKPFPCPGKCTYCPTEANMPKSYLSREPAAARALANDFDPRKQIWMRLNALITNGHPVDKIEIIVIGGTWSFYHSTYREWVIKECFRACNEFDHSLGQSSGIPEDCPRENKGTLVELQKINETAECRIVGISIETRPDYINTEEIRKLRSYGVTKVEIGVQHLDNEILEKTKREMTKDGVVSATEMLRNAGLKVVYHMMPNLPGSDIKKDIEMFRELFIDGSGLEPDMLKIYPCMVLEGSELYETWKAGGFVPYTDNELMEVLREAKKLVPPYVRILRVIRDIPADYVKAGSKISNMRQWLEQDQKKFGWKCRCIRCREVREREVSLSDCSLIKREYRTISGKEMFLSFEDEKKDLLVSFLRLRLPDRPSDAIFPVLKDAALVRELHTYGRMAGIHKTGDQGQHRGFGKLLLEEAEKTAKEAGYKKLAIISGVGVREYYRKQGYELQETYMVKIF
ncbi:MAG: tRNA uridine(34) 5-carboxymethylaminomethyl modification radical SAM/GNAT enzyme Elp3 [Candidatus Paceibacterota bacterium]|jgi:elongator complex protein 3|nr:tRNA uridine(34) 5-carboxymethylaminomethyl modification radical SAM/GNAT enzyme Elp3 [Candidatus Paceibacterota bacterium]